jgi:hypothetical protein
LLVKSGLALKIGLCREEAVHLIIHNFGSFDIFEAVAAGSLTSKELGVLGYRVVVVVWIELVDATHPAIKNYNNENYR